MPAIGVTIAKLVFIVVAFLIFEGFAQAATRPLGPLRLSTSSERIPCHPTPVIGRPPERLCQTRHVLAVENTGKGAAIIEVVCGSNYKSCQLEKRLEVAAGATARQAVVDSVFPDDPKRIANERSSCYIQTNYGRAKIY